MARTRIIETPLPETATAAQIGALVGVTDRRVQQLSETGVIPRPLSPGQYPLAASLLAIFGELRERADGLPAQKAKDQARQAKADADSAEMKAARDANLLMPVADAQRMWRDGFVKIRDVVLRSSLTPKQKAELSDKMTKIQLDA